jgi:acyl transferase domain-containing protein
LLYSQNAFTDWIRLLSNEGKSYPFDQRATGGFGRGEGAACIILKPLSAAIEAGDNIRAIIQNTGINQDGRTVGGITVPSVASQESLIRSLYNARGLDPLETRYIEAHGTGTATGDPIEVEALSRIFGKRDFKAGPTYLGSVKSNFGHLEGVSGLISVIKAAMMLERGVILPNTNFDSPNEKLQLADRNFQVR